MSSKAVTDVTKHPGGRPRKPKAERTVVATVRLTPARKAKLQRLGAAWLSKHVDEATEPSDAAQD